MRVFRTPSSSFNHSRTRHHSLFQEAVCRLVLRATGSFLRETNAGRARPAPLRLGATERPVRGEEAVKWEEVAGGHLSAGTDDPLKLGHKCQTDDCVSIRSARAVEASTQTDVSMTVQGHLIPVQREPFSNPQFVFPFS